jgi:hypothetical protein
MDWVLHKEERGKPVFISIWASVSGVLGRPLLMALIPGRFRVTQRPPHVAPRVLFSLKQGAPYSEEHTKFSLCALWFIVRPPGPLCPKAKRETLLRQQLIGKEA